MIEIGAVTLDTSHCVSFAEYFKKTGRARYSGVFNDSFRDDAQTQAFVDRYGLDFHARSLEELADKVDAGIIHSCNWDDHLRQARPFVERGKPVFIDKPLAGNLADCKALEEMAAQGATVLGCSSVRYALEIDEFLAEEAGERGDPVHVWATVGVDEFNYGCHAVEGLTRIIGAGATSVRFAGAASQGETRCESFHITYDGSRTAAYSTVIGVYQPFTFSILTTKGHRFIKVDNSRLYSALLDRLLDTLETGQNRLAAMEELTESVKILLAGRLSRERGGEPVALADIPADDPGFDGNVFQKEYAAASRPIRRFWGEE
ncbi:MAG: Gfo/Idh/MocA family oxidoreductase [Armatimonadetes bacterium]|nr:Gfo/Idh/MocA family oxidoreductase [Armatimonadota bacterium]